MSVTYTRRLFSAGSLNEKPTYQVFRNGVLQASVAPLTFNEAGDKMVQMAEDDWDRAKEAEKGTDE